MLQLQFRWRDLGRPSMLLTLLRVPLGIAFPFVVRSPLWGGLVLAGAALSDVLDGYVARRLGHASPAGAVIDGGVDKFFALCAAFSLWGAGLLAFWQLFLLGMRDWLRFGALVRAYFGKEPVPARDLEANRLGKNTTILQFVAFSVALLRLPGLTLVVLLATLTGILAALAYQERFQPPPSA